MLESVLPDWLEQGVESSLRDSPEDALPPPTPVPLAISSQSMRGKGLASPVVLTPTSGATPSPSGSALRSGGAWTDLDKFYEDDESTGEEDESGSEEESEEGGEVEEEGEEDVSDDEDDGSEDGEEGESHPILGQRDIHS